MKAFVTGATGFIGKRVTQKLLERGHDVWVLARDPDKAADLVGAGAHIVKGDITDPGTMRDAMRNCDVVFHIAGWYKVGAPDVSPAQGINVEGTRTVLGLACELGIPRIVYTSTVAVLGDTRGVMADETYRMADLEFRTEYDRTKWLAHYDVALPLIEQGCPIIIVMPGSVFGPGDTSIIGELQRMWYHGLLPVLPGPETMLTFAYIDDIAEGHLLAAEKGRPGESYLLTGPALTLRQMVDMWSTVTGKPAPKAEIPARYMTPLAPVAGLLGKALGLEPVISKEAVAILGSTYLGRADKARAELGWEPGPLHEGLKTTFDWLALTPKPNVAAIAARGAGLLAGLVVALVVLGRVVGRGRGKKRKRGKGEGEAGAA